MSTSVSKLLDPEGALEAARDASRLSQALASRAAQTPASGISIIEAPKAGAGSLTIK